MRRSTRPKPWPLCLSLLLAVVFARPTPLGAEEGRPDERGPQPPATSVFLPGEPLFAPLLADPKQPRFFGALEGALPFGARQRMTIGSIGFGEELALFEQRRGRSTWQIGVAAGVFAQFQLDGAQSYPLLNADYVFGIPLSWRRGAHMLRLRVTHSSSHLGDELLLLDKQVERMNLSSEELELLAARDISGDRGRGRLYAGGGLLLHRRPTTLARRRVQCGFEWRGLARTWGRRAPSPATVQAAPFAALDLKAFAEQGWGTNAHALAGVELRRAGTERGLRLFVDYYRGYVPYGQFFHQRVSSTGVGLDLVF
jgi:hypothetical protein